MTQELLFYPGMAGDNSEFDLRASGAYIFRPDGTEPTALSKPTVKVFQGSITTEVHLEYNSWASAVLRMDNNDQEVAVDH